MAIKIKIYKVDDKGRDNQEVGHFYIPTKANKEWLIRNVPDLIRGAQAQCDELPDEEVK